MLPARDAAADLIECSSLDSLKDPADVFLTLSEMVRVAKPGGHLRIVFRRRLPDIFFETLERDLGVKLLTKPHPTLGIPSELYQNLKAGFGRDEAARLRKQASVVEYILAERTEDTVKAIGTEEYRSCRALRRRVIRHHRVVEEDRQRTDRCRSLPHASKRQA